MTRLEELTLRLADQALNDAEARELESLLDAEPATIAIHLRLLEVEAALRGQRETLDLAGSTVAFLRSQLAASVERRVMQQLESEPPPAWARSRTSTLAKGLSRLRRRFAHFPKLWPISRLRRPAALALAASVLLLLCLATWFVSPRMGYPALADVKGADVSIQRGTELVPAVNGMVLQLADVLRLGTNALATIAFGEEKTRFELLAGTELKLNSLKRGKNFLLTSGMIKASVARQQPFHPMIIGTPQGEARVLGTRFTLSVTTNTTRLEVTEGNVRFIRTRDLQAVRVAGGRYAVAAREYELAALPSTSGILREYWTNLPGATETELAGLANGHRPPDGQDYLQSFEAPPNWADNYGARFRGYLRPPVTGDYKFWLAGNDAAMLLLSPDANPANRIRIASIEHTEPRQWNRSQPNAGVLFQQESSAFRLEAGRQYYIEALLKAGIGEDHLAVAWRGPGREREVIPGEFLSPFEPKK